MTFDFQVNDRRRNPDRRKNCLTPEQLESRLLLSISSVSSSSLPIVSNLAAGLPIVVMELSTSAGGTVNISDPLVTTTASQFAAMHTLFIAVRWHKHLSPIAAESAACGLA